jgi:CRP/FNR family transcriptional regulator, cyclic AMP receptor protein
MTAPVPATRACAKLLSERRDPARALRTRTGAPVMVPLLSALPDLADAVPEFERRRALAVLHVPRLDLPRGAALPAPAAVGVRGCVGLIVQRGLLSRNLCVAERPGIELFGPGDALDPGDLAAVPSAWTVHQPTSVLFLEKRFELAAGRWPGLWRHLLEGAHRRSQRLAGQLAAVQERRVEDRLLQTLWQFAERWGHVTPDGVVVPLSLPHELLGQVVGAARPTVSLGLTALDAEGLVRRNADGSWLLAPRAADGTGTLAGQERLPSAA